MGTITKKGTIGVDGLRSWFETGDVPTESQYDDFIESIIVEGGNEDSPDFPLVGALEVSTTARALSSEAIAMGGTATANQVGAIQLGSGVNSEPTSLQIGSGFRILSQAPTTPKNGDIYVSSGKIYGYSGGVKIELGGLSGGAMASKALYGAFRSPATITTPNVAGAIAIGSNTTCANHQTLALGQNATAAGAASMAFGTSVTTLGDCSVAFGGDVEAAGYSLAFGSNSSAVAEKSVAGGLNATSLGEGTLAIGDNSTAVAAQGAMAVGTNCTTVQGIGAVAIGNLCQTRGSRGSVAVGHNNTAMAGYACFAVGSVNTTVGPMSWTFGHLCKANSTDGLQWVEGENCTSVGTLGWASGSNATAVGEKACLAAGTAVTATGSQGSFAQGINVTALGKGGCWAGGTSVEARGDQGCFALGHDATAIGNVGSFALGTAATSNAESAGVFFTGFNDQENSVLVGGTSPVRFCGNGVPTSPANGDIWVAGGYTYIRSNGVSVQMV